MGALSVLGAAAWDADEVLITAFLFLKDMIATWFRSGCRGMMKGGWENKNLDVLVSAPPYKK